MTILAGAEPFAFPGGPVGVLLCHGFTGTPSSMRAWGEHLAGAGFTVRCDLLPGHGTRWQDMNRTGWRDWYAADERAFLELRESCEHVFIGGLSMGGTLALRLAELYPDDVAGLILVNPSVTSLDKRLAVITPLSWVVPSFPGIGSDIAKPGVTELAYDRNPLKAVASVKRFWPMVRQDLGRVRAPLLLFSSVTDHVVEPVNGDLVHDGVSSPLRRRVMLERSYHVATQDWDAETIFTGSVDFIREVVAAAGPA